eukprot:tig00020684_g12893.t1
MRPPSVPRVSALEFLDASRRSAFEARQKFAERESVQIARTKTTPAQRAALEKAHTADPAEFLRAAFASASGAAVKSAGWRSAAAAGSAGQQRSLGAGSAWGGQEQELEGLRALLRSLQERERGANCEPVALSQFNALLEECGKKGRTASALRIYETLLELSANGSPGVLKIGPQPQLAPDAETHAALLGALCRAGHVRLAAAVLDRVAAAGARPDAAARLRVARAALRLAREAAGAPGRGRLAGAVGAGGGGYLLAGDAGRGVEHARSLADEGAPALAPAALLTLARLAAARWGPLAGLQALEEMEAAGVGLRSRGYSALAGDLAGRGEGPAARAVLEAARDAGCTPGRDLFLALLRLCATAPRVRQVLAAMARARVPMTGEAYAAAMGACLRDPAPDGLRQFRRLYRGMEAAGVQQTSELRAMLVTYLARGGPEIAPAPAGVAGEDPAEAAAAAEERRGGRPEGGAGGAGDEALRASRLREEAAAEEEAGGVWAGLIAPGEEGRRRRPRRLVLAEDEIEGQGDEEEEAGSGAERGAGTPEGLARAFGARPGPLPGPPPEAGSEAEAGAAAPAPWERALGVLAVCRACGALPTVRVYNAALLVLSRARQFGAAMELYDEMRAVGEPAATLARVEPDRVTYGLLMHAAVEAGRVDAAVELFVAMEGAGIAPNAAIYALLVRGYGLANDLASAQYVFREMKASGIRPPRVAYDALIVACLRCRRLDEAMAAVRELKGSGLRLEADARAFFRLYGSAEGLAARLEPFRRVRGPALAELDGASLAALAGAARREAGEAAADALMHSLSAAGVRPNQRLLAYLSFGR